MPGLNNGLKQMPAVGPWVVFGGLWKIGRENLLPPIFYSYSGIHILVNLSTLVSDGQTQVDAGRLSSAGSG